MYIFKKYQRIAAPVLAFVMIAIVWGRTGIYFETNDDKYITEILCGLETGEPEARAVYVSYLLTLPLSWLYRLAPGVPWYGMTMILLHILTYGAVLESLYSRCARKTEAAAGTALTALLLLANLYITGCIEFTSTAALLTAGGYFCLLTHRHPKRRWIYFVLLEALGGMMRMNAMLMMQPMGMALAWGIALGSLKMPDKRQISDVKRLCREYLLAAGKVTLAAVAVILALLAADAFVYRDDGWKAYHKFIDAETVLFDYVGAPAYEEVKGILDKYQVTEADYNAYRSYVILDWVLSPECAEEVAEYASAHREEMGMSRWWEEMGQNIWRDTHWGLKYVLLFLWVAAVVELLFVRKLSLLLSILALLSGKLFTWGVLLYQGRFPLRISMPLLAGEIMLLTALVLTYGECLGKRLRYGFVLGLLTGLCLTVIPAGRQQYRYVMDRNGGQEIYMAGLREIGEYCNAHPENRYIVDMGAVAYYYGSALESDIYRDRNYILSGSWYSNSPNLRRYNAKYLNGGGIYFLVYDDGRGEGHPGVVHLAQRTGASPEVCDGFTASNGVPYLIYYFDGEYCIEEP
ncbi:MAG: hypothetical protein NC121_09550 [Blautia sp.]|nr:hypothetical protein [Blautia sp.]